MTLHDPPTVEHVDRIQTATRDLHATRGQLGEWLASRLGAGVEVSDLDAPAANGLSSETLLFDASWRTGGRTRTHGFAARVAPDPANLPVFPVYDLHGQFRLLESLGAAGEVPVPRTWWFEPDAAVLGAPFFVMDRVEGRVPPDVMPYNFGSWLSEATPAEQRSLQDASVRALAAVHAVARPAQRFPFLAQPGDDALRAHVDAQRRYYEWVAGDTPIPILERCFTRLEETWPAGTSDTVLCWGDARIGNIVYHGFEPVAVLDWEMAALGPREIDLAWFVFLHRFFEDIAISYDLDGMPGFLRRDDVLATYEECSGAAVRDFEWYLLYAALRHGTVMARTQQRAIHFGEAAQPDHPDELVFHRATLERMLDGSYWDAVE